MQILSWLFCLTALVAVYGLYAGALVAGGGIALMRRISWRQWLWIAGLALASLLFVYLTVRQNKFIYFWDYGSYWTRSYTVSNEMFNNPIRCLESIYDSINTSDYNRLLCLLTALPIRLIGKTFTRYVVICYGMFLLPAQFVFSLTLYKYGERFGFLRLPLPVLFGGVLLFPTFFNATLQGYIDSGCLLAISLAVFILADFDLGKCCVWRSLCLSGLILLIVLYRRYFAFWAVGLVVGVAAAVLIRWLQTSRGERMAYIWGAIRNALLIGTPALTVLLALFRPFLKRALFSDFAVQYVGYDAAWLTKWGGFITHYGYILLLLAVPVALAAALIRRRELLPTVCGILLHAVVAAFTFFRVQNMGVQHFYIVCSQILLLVYLGLGWLTTFKKVRWPVLAISGAVLVAGFANGFIPAVRPVLETPLLSQKEHAPLIRTDLPVVKDMVAYINELTVGTKRRAYVLSSTGVLNEDVLQFSEKPYTAVAVPALDVSCHVDLRDGFPVHFLKAEVVVVTDPIQTHLATGTQEVIRYLAEQVGDASTGLGRHFTEQRRFELQKGVTARVLVRNSAYEETEIQAVQAYFDGLYGDFPSLFHDRIEKYLEDVFR